MNKTGYLYEVYTDGYNSNQAIVKLLAKLSRRDKVFFQIVKISMF